MNKKYLHIQHLKEYDIKKIIDGISKVKVGVIGDACLDVYWEADMTLSELSRETPHFPLPVVKERISLGGGGNVAANVCDLGGAYTSMLTLVGHDWRGSELIGLFKDKKIDTKFILHSSKSITPAYCKPIRKGISHVAYEDPRLDFENRAPLSKEDEKEILERLDEMSKKVDIILVADQLKYGIITQNVRERLSRISKEGTPVIADSRLNIGSYRDVLTKPNEVELLRAVKPNMDPGQAGEDAIASAAQNLSDKTGKPVIVTMGDRGAMWFNESDVTIVPALSVSPPIDIVGAGDTFMSAFAAAYGSGVSGDLAVAFANMASAVVLKKIGTTGTASPQEIMDKFKSL